MSKVAKLRETREAEVAMNQLREREDVIEKSAEAVWDMAHALKEIKEGVDGGDPLFKQTHKTWTSYCEDRWGITNRWADRLIQSVNVVRTLRSATTSSRLPTHVSQADELAKVPEPEGRKQVWDRAVRKAEQEGKKAGPSVNDLRVAVKEHKAKKKASAPKPSPEERRASEAHEAASRMRSAAETFLRRVELLMPHLDNLPPDQVQSCAYGIVKTVHDVMATLEEHGHVRGDVAGAVLDSAPSNEGEIVVS